MIRVLACAGVLIGWAWVAEAVTVLINEPTSTPVSDTDLADPRTPQPGPNRVTGNVTRTSDPIDRFTLDLAPGGRIVAISLDWATNWSPTGPYSLRNISDPLAPAPYWSVTRGGAVIFNDTLDEKKLSTATGLLWGPGSYQVSIDGGGYCIAGGADAMSADVFECVRGYSGVDYVFTAEVVAAPTPGAIGLFGAALAGLAFLCRRRVRLT